MKHLVIGATTGVGRALTEALAAKGHALFLVASDERDLRALAADLSLRFGVEISSRAEDLADLDAPALRKDCLAALGGLDGLFYIAGWSLMERDPDALTDAEVERLVAVNFTAAVRLINVFLPDLAASARADVVGVGSIAQARARGRNTVYAAAKSGLEFYFEGLRHRLSGTGTNVRFYRVGYVDTQMTYGQRLPLPKASPESVAAAIVSRLGRGGGTTYVPRWWGLVAFAYRSIPWLIFRRMKDRP